MDSRLKDMKRELKDAKSEDEKNIIKNKMSEFVKNDVSSALHEMIGNSKFGKYLGKDNALNVVENSGRLGKCDPEGNITLDESAFGSSSQLVSTYFHEQVHAWQFSKDGGNISKSADARDSKTNTLTAFGSMLEVHATGVTLKMMNLVDKVSFRHEIKKEINYHNREADNYARQRLVENGHAKITGWKRPEHMAIRNKEIMYPSEWELTDTGFNQIPKTERSTFGDNPDLRSGQKSPSPYGRLYWNERYASQSIGDDSFKFNTIAQPE